jgi:hypothetical protein
VTTGYAVDTSVIVRVEKLGLLDWFQSTGGLPIVITDVAWEELVGPRLDAETIARRLPLLQVVAGAETPLGPQTPENLAFNQLHPTNTTTDAGEASIIAYCLHHADTAPIFEDRIAIQRAIEELPGREVLSLYGFFGALHRKGVFHKRDLREFDRLNQQRFPGRRPPLWWAALVT